MRAQRLDKRFLLYSGQTQGAPRAGAWVQKWGEGQRFYLDVVPFSLAWHLYTLCTARRILRGTTSSPEPTGIHMLHSRVPRNDQKHTSLFMPFLLAQSHKDRPVEIRGNCLGPGMPGGPGDHRIWQEWAALLVSRLP